MSFADKGIKQSGRTKDGKKFFDVKETRLMDILNVPITVVDFETNVKTKQGEGRYCVLFEQNGQRSIHNELLQPERCVGSGSRSGE